MSIRKSPEPMSYSVRLGSHSPFHDDRVSARVITAFQQGARREQFLGELVGEGRNRITRRRDTKLSVPAARGKLRQRARLISKSLGWAAPKV